MADPEEGFHPGDRLWSPWRSEYIETPAKGTDDDGACVFCLKTRDPADDEANLIVLRGQKAYVCMNLYPYNAGHLLVNPIRHASDLADLEEDEHTELFSLVRRAQEIQRKALSPAGHNIGINLGAAAGAGIAAHLHVHVIPRWLGDTNFMPTASNVRVISQGMKDCFDRLRAAVE